MNCKFNSLLLVFLCTLVFVITMCKSWYVVEQHSYGDECKHCHGEELQGVQNVKEYCGECHDPMVLKPEDIKVEERRDAIFNGAHLHKTKNIFHSTPSCFFCHRRTDF